MYNIRVKTFSLPKADEKEILRYAGSKEADAGLRALLSECLIESERAISPRACYCELTKTDFYRLVDGAAQSEGLKARLCGCDRVVLFAASVGLETDRLMERYAKISPVKSLLFQAIGAERIECLCEVLCEGLKGEYGDVTARFSAGYGDFPLSAQRDIFRLLDCPKKIGVSLTDGLLMTPTKSVTAVVGLGRSADERGCGACDKRDCALRKE
ncbi:MAG: Vitamin B12 dependent methionine synthase activation subunit [Clostridia bacterium]|nr:Vitamin B12 dependent methionine synthase activation subunit [Clostridia bacterium]